MNATLTTSAPVVSPALCRMWKRATEAKFIARNAAARAMTAEYDARIAADSAAHGPTVTEAMDAADAYEIARASRIAAHDAAGAAFIAEINAELAALKGDNRGTRAACKAAIRAERAALVA